MKKIYKTLLAICMVGSISITASAQDGYWSSNNQSRAGITTDKAVARLSYPKEFKLFNLNIAPLKAELFKVVDNNAKHSTVISLPNADGGIEQFEVFEASNFEPALQARFPEIRSFSGQGITDRSATLKLSISPQGMQTMIFRIGKANEFIEAYSKDHTVYSAYKSQRVKGSLPWTCSTEDKVMFDNMKAQVEETNFTGSSTGELKVMRLAQSVTAEYSNFFGATSSAQVGLVLAAINNTLARCNGCYEKDLGLHLNLIANTADVIYYNAATDPYSNAAAGASGAWNGELQNTLTSVIGEANYDIGHLFGASGGGGNAGCIGCVCNSGKGSGFTSPADNIPMGDNFDIDYVVHEVGHQLGGNHTFSFQNQSGLQPVEVGSGITIMGYAGITPQDVAPHSIDIYHARSIQQIQANMATKTCPVTTNISANNATPVVAPVSNYTIPISTPFALTGSATDANAGDVLTYCWEQNDNATTFGGNSVANPAKVTGPNWLSFSPTVSPTRLFPKLSTILAGLNVTPQLPGGDAGANIEALSSVARTLNFRLTVRDNSAYSSTAPIKVGQTAFTDMTVTVSNTSGPFAVTSPNTNVSWPGNSSQTITWDVNNTTAAPVSCANVKISLSTDGGNTFPTVLAASTANDGSEAVTIPAGLSSTARVKIESIGNIFFDISNSNFNITAALGTFEFVTPAPTATVTCGTTTTAAITLATTTSAGFNTPINLTTGTTPGTTTVTYSVNPVTPGNSTVVTLNGINTLAPGTYPITVTGTAGSEVKTVTLSYIVSPGTGPAIGTQPATQAICSGLNAVFASASATATSYQWQISTNGGGSWNNLSNGAPYSGVTTNTLTITGVTAPLSTNQYRVVATGLCGSTNSNAATLTVKALPTVTAVAAPTTVCTGTPATITASGADTYTWSTGTTPATGAVVTVSPVVAPANPSQPATTVYTVTGTATATGCSNTATASVTAEPLPVVTLSPVVPAALLPGQSVTLTASVVPAGGNYTLKWFKDGVDINYSSASKVITLAEMGSYKVTVANAITGLCSNTSNTVVITAAPSAKLFIYPNPNSGKFTVAYYNASTTATKQGITIYDSKGAVVYNAVFPVNLPYQLHAIDIRKYGSGLYHVILRDANGKKVKTAAVMVK